MLGRTPHYLKVSIAGKAGGQQVFARSQPPFRGKRVELYPRGRHNALGGAPHPVKRAPHPGPG